MSHNLTNEIFENADRDIFKNLAESTHLGDLLILYDEAMMRTPIDNGSFDLVPDDVQDFQFQCHNCAFRSATVQTT